MYLESWLNVFGPPHSAISQGTDLAVKEHKDLIQDRVWSEIREMIKRGARAMDKKKKIWSLLTDDLQFVVR